jgi:Protein of unknown function (DUF3768)
MPLIDKTKRDRIRDLNDAFRKSFDLKLGRIMVTAGVDSLPSDMRAMAIRKTVTFDAFTAENDPHGEHDFGNFELAGRYFFFKLDYYDPTLEFGSDDPTIRKRRRACSPSCSRKNIDPLVILLSPARAGLFLYRRMSAIGDSSENIYSLRVLPTVTHYGRLAE